MEPSHLALSAPDADPLDADPLDASAIEALVAGRHGAPFDVLGPHRLADCWVVRAFFPGVAAAWVLRDDGHAPRRVPMRPLHPAGLFSARLGGADAPTYRLEVRRAPRASERVADVYAFPPLLSDFDLHLIGEGTHLALYERLGAHPARVAGVEGVAFAVWAPNARRVSVVGDFNGWDERLYPMRLRNAGVWELFIPGIQPGAVYKYALLSWNHEYRVLKADPFAFWAEVRPGTASRVYDLGGYEWGDADWLRERPRRNAGDAPISVYEVHLGSWRAPSNDTPSGDAGRVTYRELARQLVPYVKDLGYTHIELMPIAEHPFDGSWGYQVTGYYAPTSRYGTPHEFMAFVDACHQAGIGVILDWVPAHFPRDEHGLAFFDGSHLYEHADPRQGAQPDWGTLIFNFGRAEVRDFFVANAIFWLDKYHIDGLRVDAVASLLYLDYSRQDGEWVPNRHGGRENLEAIAFLRECTARVAERFPDALMIAEESTAWPGVTAPVDAGGLGFSLKWNMGWMHDILEYAKLDPIHRRFHQNTLTFSMLYAYSERFLLPFSHDEVVHMKGSMLNKMPGDPWQKFANLRALYAFMYGHPGKKLLFMGGEFAQWAEWNFAGFLDWALVEGPHIATTLHGQVRDLVRDLNRLLRKHPALHALDFDPAGFEWIDGSDTAQSVISFVRYAPPHSPQHGPQRGDPLIFVCNFTPVPRYNYHLGVPMAADYEELLNTDALAYGGGNVGNLGRVASAPTPAHGWPHSVALTLPPLATLVLHPALRSKRFRRAPRDGDPVGAPKGDPQ